MRKFLLLLAVLVCCGFVVRGGGTGVGGGGGGGGGVTFTPLSVHFMAATGCSDVNSGLSAGSPWCTPNHAMNCGDVIVAAPGTYNGDFSTWGTVSNCPSATAGIDGTGGIYAAVLLCNGNLHSCLIQCSTGSCNAGPVGSGGRSGVSAGMNITKNNWAIEGWYINGNGNTHRGFQVDSCLTTTTRISYVALINDIVVNAAQGYDIDDCGYGTAVPGNGSDEWAVVGSLAQNANSDSICLAAIDYVAPANFDSLAGTHTYIDGNFAIANSNNPSCTTSDGSGIMLDTLDAHGYAKQIVVSNNIVYNSSWVGIQVFQQATNSSSPTIYIANNTFFHNELCPFFSPGTSGEINLEIDGNFPWTINVTGNIAMPNHATQPFNSTCSGTSAFHPYAMLLSAGANVTVSIGGAGSLANIFKGQASSCDSTCDAGNNIVKFTATSFGTNTFVDPLFQNTTDLLANWLGAPTCSTFTTVTACMGWNYGSQTATANTPIYDLIPTSGSVIGQGYKPPGPCAANSLYPTWLKGIVYLQYNSGTGVFTQNPGLANKPCNM